jgi:hypothetical protein
MNFLTIRIPYPTWRKLIGLWYFERGRYGWLARFAWGEISGRIGLAVALCLFEEHFSLHLHLIWPNIFVRLPLKHWHREPHDGMESWGFSLCGDTWANIHLNWGTRTKIIHLPWDWSHVAWRVFRADGIWVQRGPGYQVPFVDGRQVESWPYRYVRRSGEVQERTATIYGEELEWRWRWFTWLPLTKKVRRSIYISFDHEVGEETGSWKGGCLGCSTEWREGESMRDALQRMERERKF